MAEVRTQEVLKTACIGKHGIVRHLIFCPIRLARHNTKYHGTMRAIIDIGKESQASGRARWSSSAAGEYKLGVPQKFNELLRYEVDVKITARHRFGGKNKHRRGRLGMFKRRCQRGSIHRF